MKKQKQLLSTDGLTVYNMAMQSDGKTLYAIMCKKGKDIIEICTTKAFLYCFDI